jgi:hypothetical protein
MMGKWTEEQKAKFRATMAAKKAKGWTNTGKTKPAKSKTVVKRTRKRTNKNAAAWAAAQYPKSFAKVAEMNAAFEKHAGKGDTAFRQWVMQTITQLVKLL